MEISHHAETDKPTVYSATNHGYWNLHGAASGHNINGHFVCLGAGKYLKVDDKLVPTGEIIKVEDSRLAGAGVNLDFRTPREIGDGSYDHCFVFENDGGWHRAHVLCPETGRTLTISTSDTAIQFYTGNFLGTEDGRKDGEGFTRRQGFCLEDQRCPDAMNKPGLGPYKLEPGLQYDKVTRYGFSTAKSVGLISLG